MIFSTAKPPLNLMAFEKCRKNKSCNKQKRINRGQQNRRSDMNKAEREHNRGGQCHIDKTHHGGSIGFIGTVRGRDTGGIGKDEADADVNDKQRKE